MTERLFPVPELAPITQPESVSHKSTAVGAASEHAAIAKLLDLGHKVARPVVDDDGVDLVVDYRFAIQVKSTSFRKFSTVANKRKYEYEQLIVQLVSRTRRGKGLPKHVDFYLIRNRDTDNWWIIPREAITTIRMKRTTTCITLGPRFDIYREAWNLLEETP